jgi:hypothetical protein
MVDRGSGESSEKLPQPKFDACPTESEIDFTSRTMFEDIQGEYSRN